MIHILNITSDYYSPAEWYRGLFFNHNSGVTIHRKREGAIGWNDLADMDIIYIQRPWNADYLNLIEICHAIGKSVWIDWDDDIFNVPDTIPRKKEITNRVNQDIIKTILTMADVVTVTTEYLKEIYSPFNKNVYVIPNAVNTHLLKGQFSQNNFKGNKKIFWRGSNTHDNDLKMILPYLKVIGKKYDLHFLNAPGFIKQEVTATFYPLMPVEKYFKFIKDLAPRIFLVPLIADDFNRGKSNIAWLESTHAGAVTFLISNGNLPEWPSKCVLSVNSSEVEDFNPMSNDDKTIKSLSNYYENSAEKIRKKYTLQWINRLRLQVIDFLTIGRSE